jgi:hypothetical protein
MKRTMLILIMVWVATATTVETVKAQTILAETSATSHRANTDLSVNTDYKEALKLEPVIGFTASFAQGAFIDYQKSFHTVSEAESAVNGTIQPNLFGTIGLQARYQLFKEGTLSRLQLTLGLLYQQKGFKNKFESTYTSPMNYTDITKYEETYKLNYLSVPIQARWGNKYYGALGFSIDNYLFGSKTQKVKREQSGQGAIDSGFKGDSNKKESLLKSAITKSSTSFVVGGGIQFANCSIAVQANFSGNTFKTYPDNFKNTTLQLLFAQNL